MRQAPAALEGHRQGVGEGRPAALVLLLEAAWALSFVSLGLTCMATLCRRPS